jgi:hypothetical protein
MAAPPGHGFVTTAEGAHNCVAFAHWGADRAEQIAEVELIAGKGKRVVSRLRRILRWPRPNSPFREESP